MATGMSREDFDAARTEILAAWAGATTRDAGFNVVVEYGRKYGYKNVIAAIQGKVPKRFNREPSIDEWLDERRREETSTP